MIKKIFLLVSLTLATGCAAIGPNAPPALDSGWQAGEVAPFYARQVAKGMSVVILPAFENLDRAVIAWNTGASEEGEGSSDEIVVPLVDDFKTEFLNALVQSLRNTGSFRSVAVYDGQPLPEVVTRPIIIEEGRAPTVLDIPASQAPLELGGDIPDVVLVISSLDVAAGFHAFSRAMAAAGGGFHVHQYTRPGIRLSTRYVWWNNRMHRPISWGTFSLDPIVLLEEIEDARTMTGWGQAADALVAVLVRRTPFDPKRMRSE